MDRCFNVEEVLGKAGYETAYLFKKEKNRYRDTHCVMENEMHNDYIGIVNSRTMLRQFLG